MAGWGPSSNSQNDSNLREEEVLVTDLLDCRRIFGKVVNRNHICAGSSQRDACDVRYCQTFSFVQLEKTFRGIPEAL